ncbi:hypothetical protein CPB83DRAFT_862198 [Crepidotus variabilis]|uniref:Uncharacterized protein n=1 Tax=Crepidotus variabilis TaxID=179855 RepID=A0A9P6JKD1_9AGAR|nr:hypothetical protein CPB83DRAFT_862198 [Crepidotus variabilis]
MEGGDSSVVRVQSAGGKKRLIGGLRSVSVSGMTPWALVLGWLVVGVSVCLSVVVGWRALLKKSG